METQWKSKVTKAISRKKKKNRKANEKKRERNGKLQSIHLIYLLEHTSTQIVKCCKILLTSKTHYIISSAPKRTRKNKYIYIWRYNAYPKSRLFLWSGLSLCGSYVCKFSHFVSTAPLAAEHTQLQLQYYTYNIHTQTAMFSKWLFCVCAHDFFFFLGCLLYCSLHGWSGANNHTSLKVE